ncbi:MAG: hypothetical protein LDL30_09090 [Desulfovibrio sp.]|nr:hypothetical protein [Desulfovibrio sp.]MCA1986178.1 hypothetical protein [Desulfovibrio sp.]
MAIPSTTHHAWLEIVTGKRSHPLRFLAAKVLLGRLVHAVEEDPSPENIADCITQLHQLYASNLHIPKVQEDLKNIFG